MKTIYQYRLPRLRKEVMQMRGQALITLLFFTIIGVTITSAAIVMILVNSRSGQKQQEGMIAYQLAQSGAENGVLRLLRDPDYSGETLSIGNGTSEIAVTGSGSSADPYILTSNGIVYNFSRTVEYTVEYQDNLLQITNKRELF